MPSNDPTTPSAEQLRQDAAHYRELAASRGCVADCLTCARDHRTAAALDAEAARLERGASATPHAELRGWGVMRSDGTLAGILTDEGTLATMHEGDERPYDGYLLKFHRAVKVRLTTEGVE